ncbi:MAG: ribbon-helix-helix protein, CopG family [bacterium]|nr:ribbon-helix-helix protein, CopG family [bacterium]
MDQKVLQIKLRKSEIERLELLRKEYGFSRADLIKQAVREFIEKNS